MHTFSSQTLPQLCNRLARRDEALRSIIAQFGHPPFWSRPASFATLIHIILEQQVSLASAKAAFDKLKEKTGMVTPGKILALTDEELKACYFSRQKTTYARCLAEAVLSGQVQLKKLPAMPDDEVRAVLTQVKGIGSWTADVYLMMALQRCDLFPGGDIALISSARRELNLHPQTHRDEVVALAERWAPYRTIAAFILWHAYLSRRRK